MEKEELVFKTVVYSGGEFFPSQYDILEFLKNKFYKYEVISSDLNSLSDYSKIECKAVLEEFTILLRFDQRNIREYSRFSMQLQYLIANEMYEINYPPLLNVGITNFKAFSDLIEEIFVYFTNETDKKEFIGRKLISIIKK